MVIAGRSVHLTTLFSWASLNRQLTCNRAHTFVCNWQQPFMNDSAEKRRMTVEIISWSISTKVWDRAGIELATPGTAVSFASVTRHVTDCATRPGESCMTRFMKVMYILICKSYVRLDLWDSCMAEFVKVLIANTINHLLPSDEEIEDLTWVLMFYWIY